ncbi:MAG TPA: hypothetical protein VK846_07745, partial [Candidatus Limnocylindria bacterium]|nr:hypothetical protein [Candidatus Limnocylindria bacterium]
PIFDEAGETNALLGMFHSFWEKAGVALSAPGKSVFFNERTGVLMVRATLPDLDVVEKAVQLLNTSPPQVSIRVKVLGVPVDVLHSAASWYVGPGPSSTITNVSVTSILTEDQFHEVMRAMKQIGATDLLNAPEVTTLSGRQAQIKVVDIRYVVTDLNIDPKNKAPDAIQPIAQPFELGPVIRLNPVRPSRRLYDSNDGHAFFERISGL